MKSIFPSPILVIAMVILCPYLKVSQGQQSMFFSEQGYRNELHSGIVCGVADINGDYYDDLVVVDQTKTLWIGLNNGNAYFFWKKLDYTSSQSLWSVAVSDIDRNGMNDILIGGDFYGIQVFYQSPAGFRRDTIEDSRFYSQGTSLYDINRDGWIDYTVCDDNAKTRVFENRNGELVNNYTWLDLSRDIKQDEEGNYGCLWSDLDLDGDGDLYISKCSAKASERTDPRRINLFYRQEQDSTFSETGREMGINSSEQSWTSVSGDINGDGLPDLIVANHYGPANVYIQQAEGNFKDEGLGSGLSLKSTPFQFALEDWDNDADLDLLSVGTSVELWLNDGQGRFHISDLKIDKPNFTSMSWGDLDADGRLDLYVSYASLINNPSIVSDKIWLNQNPKNHWVRFGMKGRNSNPNGIGAVIIIYSGGGRQIREVQAGTSYGLQKSLNTHFGLGSSDRIDSMFIQWPSGILDRYYDLPVDQFYLAGEGSCITPRTKIFPRGIVKRCLGDEIELTSYIQYSQLLWNTGDNQDTITVNKTGSYFYTGYNRFNCPVVSENTTLLIDPEEYPRLNYSGQQIKCNGEILDLKVLGYNDLHWNTKEVSSGIRVNEAGKYYARYEGLCRDFYTDTLDLIYNDEARLPIVRADSLFGPGLANLHSDLDLTLWYDNINDSVPLGSGRNYESEKISAARSFWARSFTKRPYDVLKGGMKSPVNTGGAYPGTFLNPSTYFEAYRDFTLDSITVYTDIEAVRIFELHLRGDTNVLQSATHLIHAGKNRIYLGFNCKAGVLYSLNTNAAENIKNLGYKSPRLERSNTGFAYPFTFSDVCKISSSEYGDTYYYGFFDWQISLPENICYSDWVEVPVVMVTTGTRNDYPNEWVVVTDDEIRLEGTAVSSAILDISLHDIQGRSLAQCNGCKGLERLNLSPGLYFLKITDSTGAFRTYRFSYVK